MNNKGAIFSGFMYVLLVFFLMSLAALLLVLNNTKKISSKARDGAEKIIDNNSSEISITLNGNTNTCLNIGTAYSEKGFSAKDNFGNNVSVTVSSNLNINVEGEYTITYTAKLGTKERVAERKVNVIKNNYAYTGSPQELEIKCDGYYLVEAWGAGHANGLGGYTKGVIQLKQKEKLYVYVGQYSTVNNGTSFNGGTGSSGGYPGGGATDIRLLNKAWDNLESLKSRIMVAAGAGAGNVQFSHGGGLVGIKSGTATAGTQTYPGTNQDISYLPSSFGVGGGGCGGGGGYYGAGGATCASGGAGGSSFISGHAGVNAITNDLSITHTNNTLHYSGKYFFNTTMTPGSNAGHGKAKITYIGEIYPRTNTNFDNVRYVKDCGAGNTKNTGNYWLEFQIIKNGLNLALGKTPIGTMPELVSPPNNYSYSLMTDGSIEYAPYSAMVGSTGIQCVTIDLGKPYDIDEIARWRDYDGRSYHSASTSVSTDGSIWKDIIVNPGPETFHGHRANAWN